jgi:hypothetical protein
MSGSRKRARTLIPCLPHLRRSATHSPDATSRQNRRAYFCTASPRATVGNAPPEWLRADTGRISESKGAGGAADTRPSTHGAKGSNLRLREHLVEALTPPARSCSRPSDQPCPAFSEHHPTSHRGCAHRPPGPAEQVEFLGWVLMTEASPYIAQISKEGAARAVAS